MSVGIPITKAEFLVQRGNRQYGPRPAPETMEALALQVGTGLKFQCRWKHIRDHSCSGGVMILMALRRHNMVIQTTCRNGVLYVLRVQ